jgi:hypothetical protein
MSTPENEPDMKLAERKKPELLDLFVFGAGIFAGMYFSSGQITPDTISGMCFGVMLGWIGYKTYHQTKGV